MPEDRVLHHMALSFDFAIWEIFTALLNGAQLVVADPDRQLDGSYLADLIEDQKITIAGFVPSHLETFWKRTRDIRYCRREASAPYRQICKVCPHPFENGFGMNFSAVMSG